MPDASPDSADGRYIGRPIRRSEDPALVRGQGRYVDDLKRADLLYLTVLRSPHAAARIRSIDVEAARRSPGVVDVLTGADTRGLGGVPISKLTADQIGPKYVVLADERVTYVGMPVAAVVSADRALGRDAADLIEVEYEIEEPVLDPEEALGEGARLIYPELGTNRCFTHRIGRGDVDAAFAAAEHVVSVRADVPRLASVPLESRVALAEYDTGLDELTIWTATQAPWRIRAGLVQCLDLSEQRVRVIAPDVGGGFGPKESIYPEEILVSLAAMRTGRPVKWTSTRSEDLAATWHGRGHIVTLDAAADAEGNILGVRLKTLMDLGFENSVNGSGPARRATTLSTGAYHIPAAEAVAVGVFTNRMTTGPYRGAGRPEAALALEQAVDEIGRRTGLGPAEVRRKNFVRPDEFPYRAATGILFDSGDYQKVFGRALELLDYEAARARQARARAEAADGKPAEVIGIGLAAFVEPGGGGWESGVVRIEPTGKVTALTGSCPHGQGHRTVYAQILAERLGVPFGDIVIRHGDTAAVPAGTGTFGSRSITTGGNALATAADRVLDKARRLAAQMLEVTTEDVEHVFGGFRVAGVAERRVSWGELGQLAYRRDNLPDGEEHGLQATSYFSGSNETTGFGAYGVVIRIEPETGEIHVERLVAVDDCGVVVNPKLLEGQIAGGLAQGLGEALSEVIVYDEAGQLVSGTLMDYALPKAGDMPPLHMDYVETASPLNPLGVKGVGEAPTTGVPPAVRNAVLDALAPYDITTIDIPLTSEKLWRALRGAPVAASSA